MVVWFMDQARLPGVTDIIAFMALNFDYTKELGTVIPLLKELEQSLPLTKDKLLQLQKKHNLPNGQMLSKTDLISAYKGLTQDHKLREKYDLAKFNPAVVQQLRMKPVRTVSGVAPVTVLTKPYPCPGQCLFCPADVRMPKSYLASEPGAQRAEHNFFDPYLQTYNRMQSLFDMGHAVDKVELIVLGGTWTTYPEAYQVWFIKECFRALNDFGGQADQAQADDRSRLRQRYQQFYQRLSELNLPYLTDNQTKNEQLFKKEQQAAVTGEENYNQLMQRLFLAPEQKVGLSDWQTASWAELAKQQQANQQASSRCVGLVLETRPDQVTAQEARRLRRLGCTKVQLGVQSLADQVLKLNRRGHNTQVTAQAFAWLRLAGFKIHAHWMPNLYGSSVDKDKQDYCKLFQDERFKPDELKIYPCSLLESAPLMQVFQAKKWQPYTHKQLLEVLTFCLTHTPSYCRLTRVVRDIPSFEIVAGNKKTNFRQIAQAKLEKNQQQSANIRAREIRGRDFAPDKIFLDQVKYQTTVSQEIFLQYLVPVATQPKLLGFLRLSLPDLTKQLAEFPELKGCAMIREIHVYGQLVGLGQAAQGRAQHLGLGSKLLTKAKEIALEQGYKKLAVISAVGTRDYYQQRGFVTQGLYQVCQLTAD